MVGLQLALTAHKAILCPKLACDSPPMLNLQDDNNQTITITTPVLANIYASGRDIISRIHRISLIPSIFATDRPDTKSNVFLYRMSYFWFPRNDPLTRLRRRVLNVTVRTRRDRPVPKLIVSACQPWTVAKAYDRRSSSTDLTIRWFDEVSIGENRRKSAGSIYRYGK